MGNPNKKFTDRNKAEREPTRRRLPRDPGSDDVNQTAAGPTPFIRENDINFAAKGLKPGANANIFFDEIKVNGFSQRASYINVTSTSAFSSLKLNEGLFCATSKAYGEVLGTSITATANLVYVNDNFITLKITKSSGADLTADDYGLDHFVYQTDFNLPYDLTIFAPFAYPQYSFIGRVKRWTVTNSTEGVLVVEPLSGSLQSDVTDSTVSRIFNRTKFNLTALRTVSDVYANNRFQAGEVVTSTISAKTLTISATNPYVALSSPVVFANTVNTRSIVLSSNNITRDGIGSNSNDTYIVGNTINIVSGTNMGFSANVVAVVANTAKGWNEAIIDADLPKVCTSNSIYSIGPLKCDDVGGLYGIFHVSEDPKLRWTTGERLLTITDTATHNDNDYKMRAIAQYTALGKVNPALNARNTVVREQTPASKQAPSTSVTQQTPKLNDRKLMSQTFFTPAGKVIENNQVKNAYGVYLTSVDLYFKQKPVYDPTNPDNVELLPFTVEIVPVTNGLPDLSKKALATKTLDAAQIIVANTPSTSNASTNTRFEFVDPVYLLPETEYAVSLRTDAAEYQVWTARQGDIIVDENDKERRVDDNPYIGNLFNAQNASNWNPILNEDLMFRLNRASFSTSPSTMYWHLDAYNSKQTETITANSVFDALQLTGTEQLLAPTSITYEVVTKTTDGTVQTGVNVVPNEKYNFGKDTNISSKSEKRRRWIETGNVRSVNVAVTMRTTDDSVAPMLNHERFGIITYQNLINNGGLQNNLIKITNAGTGYTNTSACTFANIAIAISGGGGSGAAGYAVGNVSPAGGNTISHVIITNPGSGYTSTPTIVIDAPTVSSGNTTATAVVYGETGKSGGNIFAKYQTKIFELEDGFESGDLIVRLKAIKPQGTSIAVYFKVLSDLDNETIADKNWQQMTVVRDKISADQTVNSLVSLEYRHSLTAGKIEYREGSKIYPLGGKFKKYAIKIRLMAEDPTVPPFVDSLKVLAVPGG
jgi:hypothetical protein